MSAGQINVRLPKDKIADFCRRHHIRKLAVFGAVLHGDSRPVIRYYCGRHRVG
jgi:hypothetical protein